MSDFIKKVFLLFFILITMQCGTGKTEHSPCAGILCNNPPENECVDNTTLRIFQHAGTCSQGECIYSDEEMQCDVECSDGACIWQAINLEDRSDLLPLDERSTTDVQCVDLDNDGDLDIVWTNQPDEEDNPGGLELTMNQGGGSLTRGVLGELEDLGSWSFVYPVDVEKDGDYDLVLSRPARTSEEVLLLVNNGSGRLSIDSGAIPMITGEEQGIMFARVVGGDIDGDGDEDLFVPIAFNSDLTQDRPNVLLMNNGNAAFQIDSEGRLPDMDPSTDYTFSAAMGDVTGNGRPDIFLGEAESPQRILINDGAGFFTDESGYTDGGGPPRLPADPIRAYDCQMVDIDEDGDLDIVAVNDVSLTTGEPVVFGNHIFLNDGTGHFSIVRLPETDEAHDSRGLSIADLNLDGILDIVISNGTDTVSHGGTALEVLQGQGSGTFAPLEGLPQFQGGVFAVAVGDINGDGLPDIAGAVAEPDNRGSLANILVMSR